MDKKFVKNQDSKKVHVDPKGQPSKGTTEKGKILIVHLYVSHHFRPMIVSIMLTPRPGSDVKKEAS